MVNVKEVFIDIDSDNEGDRYFVYIYEKGGQLWLTENSRLNRSLGLRAFIRDYGVACDVAQKILDGEIS